MNKIILMVIILSMTSDVFAYSLSRDRDEKLVRDACHVNSSLYPSSWDNTALIIFPKKHKDYQCRRMIEAVMQRIRETTGNEAQHVRSDDPYEKSPIYYEPRKLSAAMHSICKFNDINFRDINTIFLYSDHSIAEYTLRMKRADIPSYRNYETDLYDMMCGVRDIPGYNIMGSYSQYYTRRALTGFITTNYKFGLEYAPYHKNGIFIFPSATVAPALWKQIGNYEIRIHTYDVFGAPDNMKNYHIRYVPGLIYSKLTQQTTLPISVQYAFDYAIRFDKWSFISTYRKFIRTPDGVVNTQKYLANNGKEVQPVITVINNRKLYAHIKDRLFRKYGVPLYFSPCDRDFNVCRERMEWNIRKKAKFLFGTGKPQYFVSRLELSFCAGFIILRESVNSGHSKAYNNRRKHILSHLYPLRIEFDGPDAHDLTVPRSVKLYPHLTDKEYNDKVNGEWMKYKQNVR